MIKITETRNFSIQLDSDEMAVIVGALETRANWAQQFNDTPEGEKYATFVDKLFLTFREHHS